MTTLTEKILVENIKTSGVFESLIPIKENDLESITQSMRQNGFDVLHPVCVWKEENVLIDGHTRLKAALDAGLNEIYCYKKSFDSEEAAIEFALNEQLHRRNLDDVGKLLLIEKLDNLKKAGRPTNETTELTDKGKSSEKLANMLGVGSRTVEKGRSVLKNADEETLDKVKSGKMSINQAYNKIKRVDEHTSTAITTNQPFSKWPEAFSAYCNLRLEYKKTQAKMNQVNLLLEDFWDVLKKSDWYNNKNIGELINHIAVSAFHTAEGGVRLQKYCEKINSKLLKE